MPRLDCEVRVWEAGDSLEAVLRLSGRDDRLVHYERRQLAGVPGSFLLRWSLPVEDLSMGPYRAEILVSQAGQEQKIQGRLELGLGPAAFGRDWPETLQLLAYHADSETIERLKDALPERRLPAFREYWQARDGLPDSPENPALEAFFAEVSLVGREYGSRWQPGWQSDRGRIRLEYGPPLRIDEVTDDLGLRRRQLWTYAGGMVFVFESNQVGDDYRLVERWGP
jgi:GWxTD domain-containing protein